MKYTHKIEKDKSRDSICFSCYPIIEDKISTHKIYCYDEFGKMVDICWICAKCKVDFGKGQLLFCDDCGKMIRGKSSECICQASKKKTFEERYQKKEFEQRLNDKIVDLQEQLNGERDEIQEFQRMSEKWNKQQKADLLEEINKLKDKVKSLEVQNITYKNQVAFYEGQEQDNLRACIEIEAIPASKSVPCPKSNW